MTPPELKRDTGFAPFLRSLLARPAFICLFLATATFALYGPVGGHDFINYDDPSYVTENRYIKPGLTWEGLKWAFTEIHGCSAPQKSDQWLS